MYRKHMRILALGLWLILLAGCGAQTEGTAKILMEEVTIASTNLKTAQAQIGDLQLIEEGVSKSDRVVVNGVHKVVPGQPVVAQ